MDAWVKNQITNPNPYKDKESFLIDDKKLENIFKTLDKYDKIVYYPLVLFMIEEKKRLIGLSILEKIKYKSLKTLVGSMEKKLIKQGFAPKKEKK